MSSAIEEELAVQLKAAGISFEREWQFWPYRKWRADFKVWREAPPFTGRFKDALVEVLGVGPQGRHGGWNHIESDSEKACFAAAIGWRVLPVTGKMVRSGRALHMIEAALGLKPLQTALDAPGSRPRRKSIRGPSAKARAQKRSGAASGLPPRVVAAASRAAIGTR